MEQNNCSSTDTLGRPAGDEGRNRALTASVSLSHHVPCVFWGEPKVRRREGFSATVDLRKKTAVETHDTWAPIGAEVGELSHAICRWHRPLRQEFILAFRC